MGNVVAAGVAYVGNRYWTYRDRDSAGDLREMVLFLAINGIGIAIQSGVVTLTYYVMHLTSRLENFFSQFVLAIALGMVFRFWCYRTFIFPQPTEPALASDEYQFSNPTATTDPRDVRPLAFASSETNSSVK